MKTIDTNHCVYRPVKGTLDYYVCEDGHIFKIVDNVSRECKVTIQNKGYATVTIRLNGIHKNVLLHRIVAQTYIDNPKNKKTVNHRDANKLNNIISNLEWATQKENVQHAMRMGLWKTMGYSRKENT